MKLHELLEHTETPNKTWDDGVYTYKYFDEGNDEGYIQALQNDILAGTLFFGRHPDTNEYMGSVEVEPEHQRKGIANKLYDFAEEIVGQKFVPDIPHTKDAEAFWRNRIGDKYPS